MFPLITDEVFTIDRGKKMTENVSNLHGRSFEYAITVELLSHLPGATLTPRAQGYQERDVALFGQLPHDLAEHFKAGARCIVRNLPSLLPRGANLNGVIIDRLPDEAGTAAQSNVTDIQLAFPNYILNLSIKNNHFALKHQRPPSLMQQLGYEKGSPEDEEYRTGLREVYAIFNREAQDFYVQEAGEPMPPTVNFRDLISYDENFIDNHLYEHVCNYVFLTLQRELANQDKCQHFFRFLVGETNFTKLILLNDRVEVANFYEIPMPTSCIVQRIDHSYIHLSFNNEWQLSLRLHTAASAIGNTPSLKFDTQGAGLPIPADSWLL